MSAEWRARCLGSRGLEIKGKRGEKIVLGDNASERRHFFGLCPACLTVGNHSACSGCLMVFYCGRDCQKKDWKNHKVICKILTKMRGRNIHIFHRNPMLQNQISSALSQCLSRDLTQYESDVLVHPRLCMVCLSGDQATLNNCDTCHCVAYCSDECRTEDAGLHKTVCDDLKNLIHDQRIDLTQPNQVKGYVHPPLLSYEKLDGKFWKLLNKHIRDLLVDNIDSSFLENQARKLSWELTCPATVLYAAEQQNLRAGKLDELSQLTVHVVGARKAEVEMAKSWLLFPARLPNLRSLTLVMVGPELEDIAGLYTFSTKWGECDVTYHLEHSAYHTFVKSTRFSEPDIVAALNCGFIFYKDWDASLNSMVRKTGVPLIFTEYYEEDCKLNLEKLKKHCDFELDVLMDCLPNKYCSRTAARIPAGFSLRKYGRKNILLSNDFICTVKRKG